MTKRASLGEVREGDFARIVKDINDGCVNEQFPIGTTGKVIQSEDCVKLQTKSGTTRWFDFRSLEVYPDSEWAAEEGKQIEEMFG